MNRPSIFELWNEELYVEFDGLYETKCLALLQSAKHPLDLQEVVLRVGLPNKEVVDGQSRFKSGAT